MKLTEDTKIFDGVDNAEFEKEYQIKDIDEPVRKQILHDQKLRELVEKRVKERTKPDTIFINTDPYVEIVDRALTSIFQQLLEEIKK